MRLSEYTAALLKDAKVDLGKLGEATNSAHGKRDLTKTSLTEGKSGFKGSEGFKIDKNNLTDAEEIALRVEAWDTAMAKAEKSWGPFERTLPAGLECVKVMFPYMRAVPATVPA